MFLIGHRDGQMWGWVKGERNGGDWVAEQIRCSYQRRTHKMTETSQKVEDID